MTSHQPDDTPHEGEKDRQYVTALARGLQILRCFTHERPALTAQEIVRMTGLPQPTVWRLCHTLSKEGFLVCTGDSNRMTLGLPAVSLGYAALVSQTLPQAALPQMQALTQRHRLGISLAVRDGTEMLYLQRTHGDFVYFNDPVRTRRPLALVPTGWACLAGYDEAERQQVLEALQQQAPNQWPVTKAHIENALAEYHRLGCIFSLGVMHEHLNAVAVPVRSLRSGQVYGLSASGLAAEWSRERLMTIVPELQALARDLALQAD